MPLEELNGSLAVIAGIMGSTIIIVGALRLAWVRIGRPMFRELREFVQKAIQVFDVILTEIEITEADRTIVKVSMPQLMMRIVTWQIEHDARWPDGAEIHIQSSVRSEFDVRP